LLRVDDDVLGDLTWGDERTLLRRAVPIGTVPSSSWHTVVARGDGRTLEFVVEDYLSYDLMLFRDDERRPMIGMFRRGVDGSQPRPLMAIADLASVDIETTGAADQDRSKPLLTIARDGEHHGVGREQLFALPRVPWKNGQRRRVAWSLEAVVAISGPLSSTSRIDAVTATGDRRTISAEERGVVVIKHARGNIIHMKALAPDGSAAWRLRRVTTLQIVDRP
jgi:hypothetical protein